jgi:hypothetical protein
MLSRKSYVLPTHTHTQLPPPPPFNNADWDVILSPLNFKLRTTSIAAFTVYGMSRSVMSQLEFSFQ